MKSFYEKLKDKDEEAFNKLYDDYVKLIYHIAYSYTRSKEDAEDITNEVFLKILNSIENYNDKGKFKEWICAIARNTACNYVTRIKDENSLTDEESVNNAKSSNDGHQDMIDLFEEFLDEVTVRIMILRFIYDYKLKEISLTLDMTIGQVQGLYYDGIEKLRKVCKNG